MSQLLSIVESPTHPNLADLYKRHGFQVTRVTSMRKAISALKNVAPDVVVAEFFYGYGNNYAGVNISNLDVFLFSLQKYAPHARVIVFTDKAERGHVDKLMNIFPLHGILSHPVTAADVEPLLSREP